MLNRIKNRFRKKDLGATAPLQVYEEGVSVEDYERSVEAFGLTEAATPDSSGQTLSRGPTERPKIVVVTTEGVFHEHVMSYAIQLAERLKHEIIAINVHNAPRHADKMTSGYEGHLREDFKKRAASSAKVFMKRAASEGIACKHAVKYGDVNKAMEELHHEVKRIDFVLTAPEIYQNRLSLRIPTPVFSVMC